jgi:hypothetical protein
MVISHEIFCGRLPRVDAIKDVVVACPTTTRRAWAAFTTVCFRGTAVGHRHIDRWIIFGEDAAHGEVLGQLRGSTGTNRCCSGKRVNRRGPRRRHSAAVLLIGATSVFGELQDALDRIWRAPERDAPADCGDWFGRASCRSEWCSASPSY